MPQQLPNREAVLEILNYDRETGVFTRARGSGRARAGAVTGNRQTHGYLQISVCSKLYYAHRLAWLIVCGVWPSEHIDHIDGDKANNRIANLRSVSRSLNMQNQRNAKINSKSGLLGASPAGNRWRACIDANGRSMHIGFFSTAAEAHEAYVTAKREFHRSCSI